MSATIIAACIGAAATLIAAVIAVVLKKEKGRQTTMVKGDMITGGGTAGRDMIYVAGQSKLSFGSSQEKDGPSKLLVVAREIQVGMQEAVTENQEVLTRATSRKDLNGRELAAVLSDELTRLHELQTQRGDFAKWSQFLKRALDTYSEKDKAEKDPAYEPTLTLCQAVENATQVFYSDAYGIEGPVNRVLPPKYTKRNLAKILEGVAQSSEDVAREGVIQAVQDYLRYLRGEWQHAGEALGDLEAQEH